MPVPSPVPQLTANKKRGRWPFVAFSRGGLIQQLELDGFIPAQAQYGVCQAGL